MRWFVALILCVSVLLCGCKASNKTIDQAILFRNKILDSNGCNFRATINADYGDKIYIFSMECAADKEGNLSFSIAPRIHLYKLCRKL